MTQEPVNQPKREDIDLFQIASKGKDIVVGFGKSIGKFVSFSFLLLLKYYYLTIIALVLGIIVGYTEYSRTTDIYTSDAVVYTRGIQNNICKQTFEQYNQFLKNGDKKELSKVLNLDELEMEKAISVEVFFGIDLSRDKIYDIIDYEKNHNARDTTRREVPGFLFTRIKTKDALFNNVFLEKLIAYMNSDPYFLSMFKSKYRDDSLYMVSLRREAKSIDSIQSIQYKNPRTAKNSNASSLIVMNEKEIKPLSASILTYNDRANFLENQLKIYKNPFTIIQNYSTIAVNEKSIKFPLFKWVFIFGVIVYVISLSLYYRKKINEMFQRAKSM